MAVILSFLVSLIFVYIYATLNKWFPSKSLIEINEAVFGKIIGKIISAGYLFYFFTLIILNARIAVSWAISSDHALCGYHGRFHIYMLLVVRKGAWNIASYN